MSKKNITEKKNLIKEFVSDRLYVPMKLKELAAVMMVKNEDRELFNTLVHELADEGELTITKRGRIMKNEAITGKFEAHDKGFGFVLQEDGDFFISADNTMGAFHGDLVQVEELKRRGKSREGRIVKILERGRKSLVGTFDIRGKKGYGFVIPDDDRFGADIFVPKESSGNAESGMKVVVQITDYGDGKKKPEGVISEVIGREGDPGIDVTSAVKAFGIEEDFDEKVLNQAERVAKPVSDADREGRTDFRELMMVTIDNDDSKDLDDAVSLYREADGTYVLGVHIADVSNYVQEKSALDRTARERGTSVYLPDRVIPMLPVTLSNGICSLNENEDRLTLSCVMRIDKQGKLLDSYVTESIINSNRRMSYSEVDALLSGEADETLKKECEELTPMFTQMKELSDIIRNRRRESGAIDFDFPEAKIELNDKGEVERITNYVHGPSSRMIEDFMLSANEAVAETYFYQGVPFIYRSHEKPDYDDLKKLQSIAANLGFTMKVSKEGIHPFVLQELLSKVEGRPEKGIIQTLALRTMKRAKYTTTAIGHFGLSMKYYCHFTSPIRRYPDLMIHRIIKDVLRGRMNEKRTEHYEGFLNEVANHSSDRERNAEELERLVDDMKMAEYMEKHIGEVYEGIISGVTSWGIYVTIMDAVEGMVRLSDIEDDFYIYNEIMLEAVGKNTGKAYRLGMSVKVRVLSSDSHSREIDFMFEE